jgi:hypothetical protein
MLPYIVALAVLRSALGVASPDVTARALELRDLDGARVRPLDSNAAAVMIVFTRSDCPIASRYMPELERIRRSARAAALDFWLVFVDPDEQPAAIRSYLSAFQYGGRALRDPDQVLVRLAGVTTTPEAAVFVRGSSEPTLVYRGAIDDRYVDVGQERPAPTRHYLAETIAMVRPGNTAPKPFSFHSTRAIGCLIADVGR